MRTCVRACGHEEGAEPGSMMPQSQEPSPAGDLNVLAVGGKHPFVIVVQCTCMFWYACQAQNVLQVIYH